MVRGEAGKLGLLVGQQDHVQHLDFISCGIPKSLDVHFSLHVIAYLLPVLFVIISEFLKTRFSKQSNLLFTASFHSFLRSVSSKGSHG